MIEQYRGWGAELIQLEHQIALQQLQAAEMAVELAQESLEGEVSMVEWLRFECHLTSAEAADRINVGKHLPHMPATVQALKKGLIGYSHLKVMARTAEAVGKVFREEELLPLALKHSPGKFHFKCLHYRHSIDPDRYAEDQEKLHEERGLKLSTAENGCLLISGCLGPVAGAEVRTALEDLAKPCGAHDERSKGQRLADALHARVTRGQKVTMNVTTSIETLLAKVGAPGAENEFSLPISSKTVQRWACDSSLSRVLLKDSVVIDVGRAERTIKGPRRRALIARDKHCQWPGCDRPASWCDAHHIVHWIHGGDSGIQNQVLLCGRHHRMVHEGGWQLVKTDDGQLVTIAPATYFQRPRGPD